MLNEIRQCKNCSLCKNQKPLIDNKDKCDIIWVGLSAKKVDDVFDDIPISDNTLSGALLSEIENSFVNINTYRTNIVKCLPIDNNNKLRYPNEEEIEKCYPNLLLEINTLFPKVVFLLGKKVSTSFERLYGIHFDYEGMENFNYTEKINDNIYFVPIHHPSYISVYKRRYKEKYIDNIINIINECL